MSVTSELCLDGKVVVVTGAGRGIGRAVALLAAAQGGKVVVNDLGGAPDGTGADPEPAEQVVAEIRGRGGEAVSSSDTVADPIGAGRVIEAALDSFGRLDAVVNNAGIVRDRMIFNMSETEWDDVIRVHLRGHFNTIKPAAAHWRALNRPKGHHRIINITSDAGLFGNPSQPNYAAAKMGIIGLTFSCAHALARYGVTTNAVAPVAATRMTLAVPPERRVRHWDEAEWSPDNVAPVITYLASEASGWCNGRIIGARGSEVTIYGQPEPLATIHADSGVWDLDGLTARMQDVFQPVIEAKPLILPTQVGPTPGRPRRPVVARRSPLWRTRSG